MSASNNTQQQTANLGLDVLVPLITHRETITWTTFSTFVAGELVLLLYRFQLKVGWEVDTISFFAIALTAISSGISLRNLAALNYCNSLARQRAGPVDQPLFAAVYHSEPEHEGGWITLHEWIRFIRSTTAYEALLWVHALFFILWASLWFTWYVPT
jgi:hypothetical protein